MISVLLMILFTKAIADFVKKQPSIPVLGLSFLLMISLLLITEAAHVNHLIIFDNEVGTIPKGYLYFSITFALLVMFFDMRKKKSKSL